MSFLKEFRDFAVRGNAVNLAVCVMIGAAFGQIVTSIVDDLFMPLIGAVPYLDADFSNLYLPLTEKGRQAVAFAGEGGLSLSEARKVGPVFAYGNFLSVLIHFFIVSAAIFSLIKLVNRLNHKELILGKTDPPADVQLLGEIRDLLLSAVRLREMR